MHSTLCPPPAPLPKIWHKLLFQMVSGKCSPPRSDWKIQFMQSCCCCCCCFFLGGGGGGGKQTVFDGGFKI